MNDNVQIKNCRPFTMMYNDFLDYEGLNSKEKLVMIMLMRYDGTTFPSIAQLSKKIGLSERTVRYAIKSLEEKKFISRQARYTAEGGQLSNAYLITDDPSIWQSKGSDELSTEMAKQELDEMAEILRSAGYSVQTPSEQTSSEHNAAVETSIAASTAALADSSEDSSSDSLPDSFSDYSADANSSVTSDDFLSDAELSELESSKKIEYSDSKSYSMNYLYQYFNYDLIRSFKNPHGGLNFRDNKHDLELLDTVFSVLYDMLNDPSPYILIEQEPIPQADVRKELFDLTFDAIIGVIDAYEKEEQQETIYDPISWLRQALYHANDPHIFDS